MEPKLCRNCRFYSSRARRRCRRPIGEEMSLVTGRRLKSLNASAEAERRPASIFNRDRCGPEGRYYDPFPKLSLPIPGPSKGPEPRQPALLGGPAVETR